MMLVRVTKIQNALPSDVTIFVTIPCHNSLSQFFVTILEDRRKPFH